MMRIAAGMTVPMRVPHLLIAPESDIPLKFISVEPQ